MHVRIFIDTFILESNQKFQYLRCEAEGNCLVTYTEISIYIVVSRLNFFNYICELAMLYESSIKYIIFTKSTFLFCLSAQFSEDHCQTTELITMVLCR